MTKQAEPPIRVLFIHYGEDWIRGSETLLIDLLRGLDPTKVRPVVWCNGTKFAARCEREGWQTFRSDFELYLDYQSPSFDPRKQLALVAEAKRIIEQMRPEVIHINSAGPGQWVIPAAMVAKVPTVVHLHINYLTRSRIAFMTHAATRIVGVSKQVLEGPLGDGFPPERAEVIYNGIDFGRIPKSVNDLRASLDIDDAAFVVTTAGSLIQRKGHDILIRAFSKLRLDQPPHLLISGGGPEREALEKLAGDIGIADRVHFLGHTDDISSVYQAANVFALASRADAFGLVIAEAGYFGLPACGTTVGGIPEVIVDGTTGILVPPEDHGALANALALFAEDSTLCHRMGNAGRKHVTSLFSSRSMAIKFEVLYRNLKNENASHTLYQNVKRLAAPIIALTCRKLTRGWLC